MHCRSALALFMRFLGVTLFAYYAQLSDLRSGIVWLVSQAHHVKACDHVTKNMSFGTPAPLGIGLAAQRAFLTRHV